MRFDPGFRVSFTDSLFIIIMAAFAAMMWVNHSPFAWLVITPVIQFFLFCNVFRIRRIPELIWAVVYITISLIGFFQAIHPGYSLVISLLFGFALIANEFRHPSYHGIMWKSINPNLETWFNNLPATTANSVTTSDSDK